MNLRHVDDFDADDSVSDSDEANSLAGFERFVDALATFLYLTW